MIFRSGNYLTFAPLTQHYHITYAWSSLATELIAKAFIASPLSRVVDNCSGNRSENGLLTMVEIVRRLEYNFLKAGCRPTIGKYVGTEVHSCQLHDSNLVTVQLSRLLLKIDKAKGVRFVHSNKGEAGQKKTECYTMNLARWIAGALKKEPDWKAFLRVEYGDTGSIPAVKSSRFWSVMIIMGDYLYPRITALVKFHEIMKDKLNGSQLGNNLKDLMEQLELFEFDCLLESVDRHGFHSPFTYRASNESNDKQARFVQRVTAFHKKCKTNHTTRASYWAAHARRAIVNRKLKEWEREFFSENKRAPSTRARVRKTKDIRRDITDVELQIPTQYKERVKAMHSAVVTKLTEHVGPITETGEVPVPVYLSAAPNTTFGVECVADSPLI